MPTNLVIVESPSKAKTIGQILGPGYTVLASVGHIRDLPDSATEIPAEFKDKKWAKLGVNVEGDFEPLYVVPPKKKRQVDELRRAAKAATTLFLATDEDREGESISWHILEVLKPKKTVAVHRVVFHELTPEAIRAGFQHPRKLDESLVRAQEARRILDRLYGYTLSPLLWRKVAPRLSAGRVQSVAVRLIVLRERQRRDFVIVDYSGVEAKLKAESGEFTAKLSRIGESPLADGQSFSSLGELTEKRARWMKAEEAHGLATRLAEASPWTVTSLETKPGQETPPVPFMTSTLQQEASRKLGFTGQRTMSTAQQLYEGIDIGGERVGLITYMRTDSLNLAERAITEARQVITDLYGKEYLPTSPKRYKSKAKNAQEAHEAIRPTDLGRTPADVRKYLSDDQYKLYELIWKRTIACQMKPAEVERTRVEVTVQDGGKDLVFSASGKRIVFPGFLRAYVEGSDDPDADLGDREKILPALSKGEALEPAQVAATEHATRPPARYTEASLLDEMEKAGVGRPSTYATITGTIVDRGYVFRRQKELVPTWTAFAVTELLEENFERLVDTQFTARMEDELDEIAEDNLDWVAYLRRFYSGDKGQPGIEPEVEAKKEAIPFPALPIGEDIVVRIGRNGPFLQRSGGGPGNTANVPDDLPPADLTVEIAREVFDRKAAGPAALGVDPNSGRCVFHKTGRFGDYLEVDLTPDELAAKATPKRVNLPPGERADKLSDADLGELLRFPINLGKDEKAEDVILAIGRYGAYLTAGERKANVGDWRAAARMSLEAALSALEQGAEGRFTRGGARTPAAAIKEFGELEGTAGPVRVMPGRFGPYVTDGKTNATIPKSMRPEDLTAEQAREMIVAKAAAGPAKKPFRRGRRK